MTEHDDILPTASAAGSSDRRPPASHPEFGQAIAQLREAKGLNRKQLAARAGVDPSTISRLESGERGVSREVVDDLARALDSTPAQHHRLLLAAGFLTDEAAGLLDEPELTQLSRLLADPALRPRDRRLLLSYVQLALDHAAALGYTIPAPWGAPDNDD